MTLQCTPLPAELPHTLQGWEPKSSMPQHFRGGSTNWMKVRWGAETPVLAEKTLPCR